MSYRIRNAQVAIGEWRGEPTYYIETTSPDGKIWALQQMIDDSSCEGYRPVWTNRRPFAWHNASKRHVEEQLKLIKGLIK